MPLEVQDVAAAAAHLIRAAKYDEVSDSLGTFLNTSDKEGPTCFISEIVQMMIANFGDDEDASRDSLFDTLLRKVTPSGLLSSWCAAHAQSAHYRVVKMVADVIVDRLDEIDRSCERWHVVVHEIPLIMENSLLEELETPTRAVRHLIDRLTQVLRFYSNIPEATYRFDRILSLLFRRFPPNCIELDDLLLILANHSPFHPYVVCTGNGELLRRVNHPVYLAEMLSEALTDYVNVDSDDRGETSMQAVFSSLDIILAHSDYDTPLLKPFTNLLHSLFPYMADFENPESRAELVRKCNRLLESCTARTRVLILKELAEKLARGRDEFDAAPLLLAWVVDEYKTYLMDRIFQQELGSFLSILENVRYDDMVSTQAYYTAIVTLHQSAILCRMNRGLSLEMQKRLISPIRDQLGDYIQLQKRRIESPDSSDSIPPIDDAFSYAIEFLVYQIGYAMQILDGWS